MAGRDDQPRTAEDVERRDHPVRDDRGAGRGPGVAVDDASPVTIRPRTPEDDERIVAIDNSITPDFPAETVKDFRHRLETKPEGSRDERYVVEMDGRVVASSGLIQMWWVEEPDGYISWIAVDQEYRRRGIGSALYDHLMERAHVVGASRLKVWIREGDEGTSRFALSRGYNYTPRTQRLSRLDVRTANLDGFEGVEERLRDGGVRIATLAEIGMEEDFLRKLHAMSDATIRDVPSSDPFGSTPFEIFLRDLTEGPGMSPEWCWVAVDGDRPVGLAFLKIQGDAAFNEYTATDREYRGRGIARALKLRTILWCREHGINYVYTGNDIDNKRMLDINIRLGYEMLPPFREVVKELK